MVVDMLYELNTEQKLKLEQRRIVQENERIKNEQFPFHPQLITTDSNEEGLGFVTCNGVKMKAGWIEKRTMEWQQQKEEKIKALKNDIEERELEDCTFKPVLLEEDRNINSYEGTKVSMKSIEKHITKQKQIRDAKEQAQKCFEQGPGSGKLWSKKLTVPKAPSFAQSKKPKISANHQYIQQKTKENTKLVKYNKKTPQTEASVKIIYEF